MLHFTNRLQNTINNYKLLFKKEHWLMSMLFACIFLLCSFWLSILSNRYASSLVGPALGDIVLDHMPLVDVSALHIYGASLFWVYILCVCLFRPQVLVFALKTTALFLIVRSAFVVMTHMGPPENLLELPPNIAALYIYKGDLFFSGHVGGPFLFALILWEYPLLRVLCICTAIFFSVVVLLGRIHYSIDVFASYFIAHSVCVMAKRIFAHDFHGLTNPMQ